MSTRAGLIADESGTQADFEAADVIVLWRRQRR
jgi:hypothetical protein